jgi:hypothetical protein
MEALHKLPPSKEVVVLTSRREMDRWLRQVRASAG